MKVGFIGLGIMGAPMAEKLLAGGHTLYAHTRHEVPATLLQQGAIACRDPQQVADEADVIFIMVPDTPQVEEVLFGERGCAAGKLNGKVVVDMSSISPLETKAFAQRINQLGAQYLDAPVSGGAAKAEEGQMTVMAAGADATFERLQPVLNAIAGKVYRIGETIGLGATVKIIHQLLAGVHIAAGAEAMALAARAGIPLDVMYDVVTHAAGNSWMFENRMRHVVDGDYTPKSAVDIFVKDLGLVADTARALHFPLPLASTAFTMFTAASNAGYGKEDDSAVIKIFAGIDLPQKKEAL
ncbi:L-threonate dehydrogenase [Serratia marcescens]|uniref:L-threonate dehydrogenase n=2 Tax=Serratia marcescens TaxID=615 RepID=UPI001F0CBA65|nr:L-threonate dehydrogenase [Serratia marcescens]